MFLIVKVEFNFKRWSAMVTCPSDVKILNKTCAIHLDPPHKDLKASFVFLKEMIILILLYFRCITRNILQLINITKLKDIMKIKRNLEG